MAGRQKRDSKGRFASTGVVGSRSRVSKAEIADRKSAARKENEAKKLKQARSVASGTMSLERARQIAKSFKRK
jgi:hypothetical protein